MFSNTLSPKNRLVIWNERATPMPGQRVGRLAGDVAALQLDLPASGRSVPAMRLNAVLLPAPFGPMIEVMRSGAASKLR